MMRYVLFLADARATRIELAGGKGSSLASLVQRGHPVPDGAVVSADAYREFVAGAEPLFEPIAELDVSDHDALVAVTARVREGLARRAVPDAVRAELARWLADASVAAGAPLAWAVRSSGTLEDLAGAAFAGQHDTFLNCATVDEVVDRVKDCWLSLWHERAVAYRARLGFADAAVAMAVVVQRMIPSDAAGVAFTVDPVAGALDRVVIDANFGLGESVVSGEGAVDHFVVERATRRIVERRLASKTHRVVAGMRGTVDARVAAADAERPSLTDDEIVQVADLALGVEQGCGGWPQDIEWALHDGRLWLLQARPITALAPRWTRDESAERFPGVVTPLTWDFVERGFHRSLEHSLRLMGMPPFGGRWFALRDHYVYGNQNAVELYARRAPFAVSDLAALEAALPALLERFAWLRTLPDEWHRALPRYLETVRALLAEPTGEMTLPELWVHVERIDEVGSRYFLPNIAISVGHGLLHRAVESLATLAAGPSRGPALASALLACETMTSQVNAELRALAALLRDDERLASDARALGSRALLARRGGTSSSPFWPALDRFLEDHGHRETDFDAYHPTWADAPWVVLDQLCALCDVEAATPRRHDAQREGEKELLAMLPDSARELAAGLVRLARVYVQLDDLEHYQTTRLSRPLRRALLAIGERLRAAGTIADAADVFFARRNELAEAIQRDDAATWRSLASEMAARKASYLAARDRSPAWEPGVEAAAPRAADALGGLPGSPGIAEGAVHIVRSSDDFAHFPRGAILVARTTNPAWTPLFHAAAGVVTESGGPLSHGAVTAREMGIPAVMSVRGVLEALRDGDRVRIDGGRGRVERVAAVA